MSSHVQEDKAVSELQQREIQTNGDKDGDWLAVREVRPNPHEQKGEGRQIVNKML